MQERTDIEKLIEIEAKVIEQEHRLFPVWLNFMRRNKYKKGDIRRTSTLKALLWSFMPKPTPTIIALSFVSLITLFFAYEANVKLENQNTLLLIQNELQESQRRSSLNIEISSIMERINIEREANRLVSLKDSAHNKKGHKIAPYVLSDITAARIASISRSLRPYRVLKTDRVNLDKFNSITNLFDRNMKFVKTPALRIGDFLENDIRSPEREQLLVALITMRISFSNIGKNSNFDYSNIQSFPISRSDLQTVNLNNSNLNNCSISYTIFDYGNLKNTNLSFANGTTSSFIQTDLEGSSFESANLNTVNFRNANLKNVNFRNAILIMSNFNSADLEGIDFENANLNTCDFKDVSNFSLVKSFKNTNITNVQNLSDSLINVAISRGAFIEN
ncbi:MAG: pentapeptide repeat-containing protein [Bacteroidales bacterium]|nr:pentapeptide repeat-containing protein [Bacteroidales bacterium]MCF8403460.1 pentapeptide repeat-containing protein [Bacteroidales bacterium]